MKLGDIRRGGGDEAGIDLAPLIDMVFILLIFFMVSTRFVQELEIDLERPGAASGEAVDARTLRVVIDAGTQVYVEGQPVNRWMVRTRVGDLLRAAPDRPVLVVADRRVDTGTLVQVVDECRRAGARDVGLDVEQR